MTVSHTNSDEQLPLLSPAGDRSDRKKPNPLPKLQICALLLSVMIEPIASQCIYPFINQLVREIDITGGDETKVGYYAGMIESLFFATQAMTVLQWSRASDHIGRKPVLLLGVFGLSISMFCFGLSRTFTGLVLSRCITGALNGNIGVMKSMLGELTDSTNMAQGLSLLPIAWSVGMTVGPVIGGTLARPQDNFPRLFSSPFWAQFPYFLPCGVTAGFSLLTFGATLLFLKETLPPRAAPEKLHSSVDREAGGHEISYGTVNQQTPPSDAPIPLSELLSAPRVLRIANYGVLAALEIAVYSLQPLFYSTPIEYGGLGFTPMQIGLWMACFGICNGLFQALCFAPLVYRLGPKTLLRIGHLCFIPIFSLFPIINWIAQQCGLNWLVWVALICHLGLTIIMDMSFSCILMYITAAAPNRRCLGALNGVAQTTASIVRAVGPASATSLFAYSIQHNFMGGYGVYIILVLGTIATMPLGAMLPDDVAERC
ncbi:MFS general substrate transporter [Boletus edulis BED1]|uniref:MFS general substrate transporter n=1 Tax=Boletus edulis BED1 TaxID=1328754 RepID=A0AAD4GFV1_BOLED|nr:MFS general substrate transporter [Boletus edulis BED1]